MRYGLVVLALVGCGFSTRPLAKDADERYDEDDVVSVRTFDDDGGFAIHPRDSGSRVVDYDADTADAADGSAGMEARGGTGGSAQGVPDAAGEDDASTADAAAPPPPDSGAKDAAQPEPDAQTPPNDAATDAAGPEPTTGQICEWCDSAHTCTSELYCLKTTGAATGLCLPMAAFQQPCSELCAALPHAVGVFTAGGLRDVCAPPGDTVQGCESFRAGTDSCD